MGVCKRQQQTPGCFTFHCKDLCAVRPCSPCLHQRSHVLSVTIPRQYLTITRVSCRQSCMHYRSYLLHLPHHHFQTAPSHHRSHHTHPRTPTETRQQTAAGQPALHLSWCPVSWKLPAIMSNTVMSRLVHGSIQPRHRMRCYVSCLVAFYCCLHYRCYCTDCQL